MQKLADLRNAIYNVPWPHRHPDSESVATSRHPANALLNFVENLEAIEDEKWMALEATITGAYGKAIVCRGVPRQAERSAQRIRPKARSRQSRRSRLSPPPPRPHRRRRRKLR